MTAITLYCHDRSWDVSARHTIYRGEPIAEFLAAQPNQPRRWLAAKLDGEMIWTAPMMDAETLADVREAATPYTDAMLAEDARRDILDAEDDA